MKFEDFKINHTMPMTEEYNSLIKELFCGKIGENAVVGAASVITKDVAPNTIVAGNPVRLVKNISPKP